ncbi:MAG TPA: hypothetical protein PLP25_10705, partial [Candidatus Limiplasma sp.]|nr:hypothetical protein [Candidatus Limiplasma sp.]
DWTVTRSPGGQTTTGSGTSTTITGLAPGTYALPVQLTIRNVDESAFTYAITPQNVSVTIAAN